MLKADFSQQDENEGESPLQPCDHCLQLRQGRGRGGRVLLGFLSGGVTVGGSCRSGLLKQRGGPVLQRVVVKMMVVVVMVVLRRPREESPSF